MPRANTTHVSANTEGLQQLAAAFAHVQTLSADMRPVWRAVVPAWIRSNRRMFLSSGASKGAPWVQPAGEELRRYVQGYKAAKRAGSQLLVFNAGQRPRNLMRSLTEREHSMFIGDPEVSPTRLVLGTRVHYSENHDGTARAPDYVGAYTIPRREHVLLGQDVRSELSEFLYVFAVQLAQMLGQRITTGDLEGLPVAAGGVL